jgi:hypothetical protein
MATNESLESLLLGVHYPLVRDYLAYGLGMVSCTEARNLLALNTKPTSVGDIVQDDVDELKRFVDEAFGFEDGELAQLNEHPLHNYITRLARALERHKFLPDEACDKMRQALPADWVCDVAY